MQQGLVVVRYRLSGDSERFRRDMEEAAPRLAALPGLVWKIWGLDTDRGAGLSAYLFDSASHASAFLESPVLERLRRHPAVAEVAADFAPIDSALSKLTGAASALATAPAA